MAFADNVASTSWLFFPEPYCDDQNTSSTQFPKKVSPYLMSRLCCVLHLHRCTYISKGRGERAISWQEYHRWEKEIRVSQILPKKKVERSKARVKGVAYSAYLTDSFVA